MCLAGVGDRDTEKDLPRGVHLGGHCGCPREELRSLNGEENPGSGENRADRNDFHKGRRDRT